MKLYMFRTVRLSIILVLLESCLQTCMTYTIVECTVNKLLMMDDSSRMHKFSYYLDHKIKHCLFSLFI
jgi:hypothetical protein